MTALRFAGWVIAVAGIAIVVSSRATDSQSVDVGNTRVHFLDGRSMTLDEYRDDQAVVLKFWATWCGECLEQMPEYRELSSKFGNRMKFFAVNIAINDSIDRVQEAVESFRLEMDIAYDSNGSLWRNLDIRGTPTYVLIDATGRVAHVGNRHDEQFYRALEKLAANGDTALKSVTPPPQSIRLRDLLDIDGNRLDSAIQSGRPVLVYRFATWCETYLKSTYGEQADRCKLFRTAIGKLSGYQVIGMAIRNNSAVEDVRAYREKHAITHPLIFDESGAFDTIANCRDFPVAIVLNGHRIIAQSDVIDDSIIKALQN